MLLAVGWATSRLAGEALCWEWARRSAPRHPWADSSGTVLASLPLAGAATALFALVPARPWLWWMGTCPCLATPGAVHLCALHPAGAAPLVPMALAALALLAMDAAPRLGALALRVRATASLARGARRDGEVWSVRLGAPAAFVAGWAPRVYVDEQWWRTLGPAERGMVLAHERCHLSRRDPLRRLLLELGCALWAPRGAALVEAWRLSAEVRADREAARGDPATFARFLVAQARLSAPRATMGLGGASLEVRIRALLDPPPPAVAGPLVLAGALALVLLAGSAIHRVAEWLLNA